MSKNKKNLLEITNIKINLPNQTINLTSEEARQVAAELNKLFTLEPEKSELQKLQDEWTKKLDKSPSYIPYPIYIPRDPFWNKPDPYYPWSPIIWCGTACETTTNFNINRDPNIQKYNAIEINLTN